MASSPDKIRTFAIIGHGGSGKTTLVESMLHTAGVTSRAGRVDDGTSKTDYDPEEIKRKITINPVPATFKHGETELTLIDTPGYVDFMPEVRVVMPAVDAAVLVINGQSGAEGQTERVWEMTRELGLPVIAFVSKLDKENTEYDKCVKSLRDVLEGNFVPFTLPLGQAESLCGYIDVVTGKGYKAKGDGTMEETAVPADGAARLEEASKALTEAAAETDDELMMKYLEGGGLSAQEIAGALSAGVKAGKIVPVLAGTGAKGLGVRALLDAIALYLPSPAERPRKARKAGADEEIVLKPDPAGETVVQVFKVLVEQHVGELSLVRVMSGTLTSGSQLINVTRGEKEKIGNIVRMVGRDRSDTSSLVPGEIGALLKLKATHMGDTLAAEKVNVELRREEYPPPTLLLAIKPVTQADQEKLSSAVARVGTEDPSVKVYTETKTRETIMAGYGDVQLEIFIARLKQKHNVNVEISKPKVPYQETVQGTAEAEGKVKKQSGGRGQFAVVNLRVSPKERGTGFEFEDAIVGGTVPRQFIPAVEKGLLETIPQGPLAGYPVTDVKVTLFFGKYHDVDSSEFAFKTAASLGFKDAMRAAKPVLLEPIMNVKVLVPDSDMGTIMGDLSRRRGRVQGTDSVGKKRLINAQVPMSEMGGYITALRSITGARGDFSMTVSHYEEVPPQLAQSVIDEAAKDRKETEE